MAKKTYTPARVYERLSIEMEGALLAGSVVQKMKVDSAGQEVHDIDYLSTESPFNHDWGE